MGLSWLSHRQYKLYHRKPTSIDCFLEVALCGLKVTICRPLLFQFWPLFFVAFFWLYESPKLNWRSFIMMFLFVFFFSSAAIFFDNPVILYLCLHTVTSVSCISVNFKLCWSGSYGNLKLGNACVSTWLMSHLFCIEHKGGREGVRPTSIFTACNKPTKHDLLCWFIIAGANTRRQGKSLY